MKKKNNKTKSSIKAKQLCALIAQSMINIESLQNERIAKLASDTKLELNDIKACKKMIILFYFYKII